MEIIDKSEVMLHIQSKISFYFYFEEVLNDEVIFLDSYYVDLKFLQVSFDFSCQEMVILEGNWKVIHEMFLRYRISYKRYFVYNC